ncbi:tetratricopeptide repeat protein [Pedobacter sp. NJ-S-72]
MYRIIKYYSGLSILLIFTSLTANAQDQKPALKTADEYYDRFNYKQAIPIYEKLAKKNKVKTALLEKLAVSYLEINNYQKSADWYKLVITRSDANAESYLNYGDMLKSIGDYAKAKEIYALYKRKGVTDVNTRISGSDSAVCGVVK